MQGYTKGIYAIILQGKLHLKRKMHPNKWSEVQERQEMSSNSHNLTKYPDLYHSAESHDTYLILYAVSHGFCNSAISINV